MICLLEKFCSNMEDMAMRLKAYVEKSNYYVWPLEDIMFVAEILIDNSILRQN